MEVLDFYWAAILAGMFLFVTLSLLGRHLVARNQSVDILLLSQEFQCGILLSTFVISLFETDIHNDHLYHLESLISFIFVLISHFFFLKFVKKNFRFKVEGAIVYLILLMGLGQFVVAFSPLVEFHMVKSFLGDIVTVSQTESVFVSLLSLFCLGILYLYRKPIFRDTIDYSLFNRLTKKSSVDYIFISVVLVLMLFSIHLFGTIFTVGALLIPSFLAGINRVPTKRFIILCFINTLSVCLSFLFLIDYDRFPTTVLIILLSTLFSYIFSKTSKLLFK